MPGYGASHLVNARRSPIVWLPVLLCLSVAVMLFSCLLGSADLSFRVLPEACGWNVRRVLF